MNCAIAYRNKRKLVHAKISIVFAWIFSTIVWSPGIIGWQFISGNRTVPIDQCYVQVRMFLHIASVDLIWPHSNLKFVIDRFWFLQLWNNSPLNLTPIDLNLTPRKELTCHHSVYKRFSWNEYCNICHCILYSSWHHVHFIFSGIIRVKTIFHYAV